MHACCLDWLDVKWPDVKWSDVKSLYFLLFFLDLLLLLLFIYFAFVFKIVLNYLKVTVFSLHQLITLPISTNQILNSRKMIVKEPSVNLILTKLVVMT